MFRSEAGARAHKAHPRLSLLALALLSGLLPPRRTSACTIGAFSPLSTQSGAAILWKNRDVANPDQEIKFFSGGRFRFIANVYAGESTDVWAGINEAGFAIMNSNSYNLGGRKGKTADDGNVMYMALGRCASITDFCKLMDSLNVVGRSTPANYGVFDSTGATLIFEAGNTFYKICDASLDSYNFSLRANYSFSGDSIRLRGRNRWLRAMELAIPARQQNIISADWILQVLCRDLGQLGFNPYPLPFTGRYGNLPRGYLPTESTISRQTTRSVEIMVGRLPECPVGSEMMWAVLGSPDVGLPVPLWIAAGKVPPALDGYVRSQICDEAARVHSYIHSDPRYPAAVNTVALYTVQTFLAPVESLIFAMVESSANTWHKNTPLPEQAYDLSQAVCETILAAYRRFRENLEPERAVSLTLARLVTPANSRELLIQLPTELVNRELFIYDAIGRRRLTITAPTDRNSYSCDISSLPRGSYFILTGGDRQQRLFRLDYFR
ncbi:MAG: hypothetical protein ABIK43_00025 [candidate division WOR-3 bacterium]